MALLTYTALSSYQAFVQKYGGKIMSLAQIGFETAKYVDHMPGVKGTLTETRMSKNGNLLRGYDGIFKGYDSQVLTPVHYTTDPFKTEFTIKPEEVMYHTYLGFLTSNGFDPKEWPFERYFLTQHMEGVAAELEVAIWEGVKSGGGNADDPIITKIDGFGKRINDAITAGTVPEVTGTIDESNIVDALKLMHSKINKAYKARTVRAFLSINHESNYFEAKGQTLQYITDEWMSKKFNTARLELVFVPGLDDNKIVITPAGNLVYNYDDINDITKWYFREEHYHLEGSAVMRAGTTIRFTDSDILIPNDQW